ncbi:hypothetical protein T492DRAFT_623955 [Pavlovales sp. CCMP2436]|nr:hypothetical protein T492DRAFT_623955 [Pavlovales sp. CCMP2436]
MCSVVIAYWNPGSHGSAQMVGQRKRRRAIKGKQTYAARWLGGVLDQPYAKCSGRAAAHATAAGQAGGQSGREAGREYGRDAALAGQSRGKQTYAAFAPPSDPQQQKAREDDNQRGDGRLVRRLDHRAHLHRLCALSPEIEFLNRGGSGSWI